MPSSTIEVPNISCGHCVMAIQRELDEMDGVSKVTGDPEGRRITVEWEPPASLERIKAALREINYPAAD